MKNKINKRLLKYTSAVEAATTDFTNPPGTLDLNDGLTNVDLDGDWNDDIRINIQSRDGGDRVFAVKPFNASPTVIFTGISGSYYLEPFALGDTIDGNLATPVSSYGLLASNTTISTFNNFDSGNDFIGFSFDIGGNTHYGWLELNVTDTDTENPGGLQVNSLAGQYESESTPGASIVISEPSTYALGLGLLAAGAAGIRERRRMKKANA